VDSEPLEVAERRHSGAEVLPAETRRRTAHHYRRQGLADELVDLATGPQVNFPKRPEECLEKSARPGAPALLLRSPLCSTRVGKL
jgi:hypothetical protein